MKCEICNQGPMDGVTVHRVNEYGVKGIWRCEKHLTPEQAARLDPETIRIVKIIEGKDTPQRRSDLVTVKASLEEQKLYSLKLLNDRDTLRQQLAEAKEKLQQANAASGVMLKALQWYGDVENYPSAMNKFRGSSDFAQVNMDRGARARAAMEGSRTK